MVPTIAAAAGRVAEHQLHTGLDRVVIVIGQVTAGQRFLDQHAGISLLAGIQHRSLLLFGEVVGHHQRVAGCCRRQAAGDRLGGHAEGPDQALLLQLCQCFQGAQLLDDIEVVAIRVDQDDIEVIAAQSLQAAFDGLGCVSGLKSKRDCPLSNSSPTLLQMTHW